MSEFILLPVILGLTVIAQGTLNRQIGLNWGLPSAVLLNASVFLFASLLVFLFAKNFSGILPEYLRLKPMTDFKWWYVIPGLCGFILVLGLPWSLRELGASKTFVLLVTTQIVSGLLVDQLLYQNKPNLLKILGAILTIAGATLSLL